MNVSTTIGIIGLPGVIFDYAGSTAPAGFLLCDGSAVSRTDYADLFAVISTIYGAGNGSTTFNLPDSRGRGSIGAGSGSGLTARTLGTTGGAETHTLSTAEMPTHTHIQDSHTHGVTDPGHNHSSANTTGTGSGYNDATVTSTNFNATGTNPITMPSTTGVSVNSTIATNQNAGSGGAHNNMQPWIALNKIIKF